MLGSTIDIVSRGLSMYTEEGPGKWIVRGAVAVDCGSSLIPLVLQARLLKPWSRAQPTRSERASIRASRSIGLGMRVGVLIGVSAINYIGPRMFIFVKASHPPDPMTKIPALPIKLFLDVSPYLLFTLYQSSIVFQLMMNERRGTYAGSLGLMAYAGATSLAAHVLTQMTWVVGRYHYWEQLDLADFVPVITTLAMAWQAATLPRVPQVVKPEDDDAE